MTGDQALTYVQNQLPPDLPARGFIEVVNYVQHLIRGPRSWSFDFGTGTIDAVAVYNTGTIAVANGDATVTGTGTTFTSAMAGRKIRIGQVPYRIATFTDTTHVELDATFPGTTESGLSYNIYQDEYALASDMVQLTRLWDVTNRRRLHAAPVQVVGDRDFRTDSSGDALQYSLFGLNSSNNHLVRLSPYPTAADRYEYWYEKDYTKITAIGDTIDIPSELDLIVKQGCLARVAGRLGLDEKGTELASFAKMLEDAYAKDRVLMDMKVRLHRSDQAGSEIGVSLATQVIE